MPCRPVLRNRSLKTRLFLDGRSSESGVRRDHCVILTRATRRSCTFRKPMQVTSALIKLVVRGCVASLFWGRSARYVTAVGDGKDDSAILAFPHPGPASDHRAPFQLVRVGIVGIVVASDQAEHEGV